MVTDDSGRVRIYRLVKLSHHTYRAVPTPPVGLRDTVDWFFKYYCHISDKHDTVVDEDQVYNKFTDATNLSVKGDVTTRDIFLRAFDTAGGKCGTTNLGYAKYYGLSFF